ncbi:hypothetical protein BIW11_02820 [Tropilaelaps mercedesae]|uniref:Cytochrome c oxidase assembly factor 5 n=1 Tax=Tropilaelaps mercedesae TaxID=418985 RepID=A0A1V9XWU0_9ACAR|nr:hypothetical protein BIW11_02820 [Tropilaelaps mercedesae]
MPVYTEEGEALKKQSRCHGVRVDLKACLRDSDCVKQGGNMRGCLKLQQVPQDCINLATLLFECKRALLDNRQRFRERRGY